MNNKVEVAGINTSSLKTLSDSRAAELMMKMKNGDRAARDEFITGNLRLVLAEIGKLRLRSDCADDLFQAGCVGLIKAADNFDPGQNVRFSTYAVPMIDGEIRRYLRQSCVLKVGRSTKDLAFRALSRKEQLSKKNGAEPDTSAIAEALGRDEADVRRALDAIADPLSLYEPVNVNDGGDDISLSDRIADCCGIDGVIIPERRSVSLDSMVAKASAGAMEYVPVARVTNLAQTLRNLKEKEGFWVCGTDMNADYEYHAGRPSPW